MPANTTAEFAAWQSFMKAARGHWNIDPIHDGITRPDVIAFHPNDRDASRGLFIIIDADGLAQAGNFEGAIPHMGEALYTPLWSHKYESADHAKQRLFPRMGFLPHLACAHS